MIHEAFIYCSADEYVCGVLPFLREGVDAGESVVAVTTPRLAELLRHALGSDAPAVAFVDPADVYERPGKALLAWLETFDDAVRRGTPRVRGVGDALGVDPAVGHRRWMRYESLMNRAFADRPAWVLCTYDASVLPPEVIAQARLTHPTVRTAAGRGPSPEHFAAPELGAVIAPAEEITGDELTRVTVFDESELSEVRRAIVRPARALQLRMAVIQDLVLAARELTAATLAGTGQPVTVRTVRTADEWLCEVSSDAELGSGGASFAAGSLALTIGRIICDRVDVADRPFAVRFVFAARRPDPRERILAAAGELFGAHGARATTVDAIIARAGVAKATFYSHFQSKDGLVTTWIGQASADWREWLRSEVEARAPAAPDRIAILFEVLGESIADDVSHGAHALRVAEAAVEAYLRELAGAAGVADPDLLARQLLLIVQGAMAQAAQSGSDEPTRTAAAVARTLVASA